MLMAVRGAAVDAERDRNATEARYREEHRGVSGLAAEARDTIDDERTRQTLSATLAADARADMVLSDQERHVTEQRRLCDRLAVLTPPVLFHDAVVELAGNGHTRWDDYVARVGEFHKIWKTFFVERAQRKLALATADYARFPRFQVSVPRSVLRLETEYRIAWSLIWIGTVVIVLLAWAQRRLSRSE
jgi:hypothetical protein